MSILAVGEASPRHPIRRQLASWRNPSIIVKYSGFCLVVSLVVVSIIMPLRGQLTLLIITITNTMWDHPPYCQTRKLVHCPRHHRLAALRLLLQLRRQPIQIIHILKVQVVIYLI